LFGLSDSQVVFVIELQNRQRRTTDAVPIHASEEVVIIGLLRPNN